LFIFIAASPNPSKFMKNQLAASLILLFSASFVAAQTPILWTGDAGTSFTDNGNWVGGTAPENDTITNTAGFGSSIAGNQPNLGGNRSVTGLVFESTTGGWTLSGSNSTILTLGASGISDSATSGITTINTSIQLSGGNSTYSVGVGGRIDILGSVRVDGAASTVNSTTFSGGTFSIRNIDSTAGNSGRAFNKNGNGTLIINEAAGSNWTSGNFRNIAGTTVIGDKNALGTGGTINLEAATLQASTDMIGANAVSKQWNLNGGIAVISGNHSLELSGNMTGADNRTLQNDIASGKTLTLSGTTMNLSSTANNRTMNLSGTGNTTISGNIVNGGTSTASNLAITNTGVTVLSGTNSYAGTTTFSGGGVLRFATVNSLYNGTEASWTNTNINVSGAGTTFALNVGGTGEFSSANVTTLLTNLTTSINNNGLRTGTRLGLDTTNATGGVFTYGGSIANSTGTGGGALGLTKFGTNTLELTAASAYTGGTIVSAGTLLVNNLSGSATGAGSVTVNSGAILGGAGSISGAVNVSGSLAPGNSIDVINTGSLTIASTGTLDIELGRDGLLAVSDRVNVTGTVNLDSGANLQLTLYTGFGAPQLGDVFYLVSNDGVDAVNGVFTRLNGANTVLNEGSRFEWNSQLFEITYQASFNTSFTGGNDIAILAVIPEPSSAALLFGGLLALAVLRRHRRK